MVGLKAYLRHAGFMFLKFPGSLISSDSVYGHSLSAKFSFTIATIMNHDYAISPKLGSITMSARLTLLISTYRPCFVKRLHTKMTLPCPKTDFSTRVSRD